MGWIISPDTSHDECVRLENINGKNVIEIANCKFWSSYTCFDGGQSLLTR